VIACAATFTGCSLVQGPNAASGNGTAGAAPNQNSGTAGAGGDSSPTSPAGTVPVTAGLISTSVPMFDVIPGRIENALTLPATTASPSPSPLVNALSGNFATALVQQGPNLSVVSDPSTATGANAVPLLAFAACNDVKPASYGVSTSGSISSQATNIVNAGLAIVNQCSAGLAASGTSLNTSVTKLFTDLTTANSGTLPADAATYNPPLVAASPVATTAQAFISVCSAATTFCTSMMSF
jgi:hypothetical protein